MMARSIAALALMLLAGCQPLCCDCPWRPWDSGTRSYDCSMTVRPVDANGDWQDLDGAPAVWLPLFDRAGGDWLLWCEKPPYCAPAWEVGGPASTWTFGQWLSPERFEEARLWGLWKVPGFASALTPLVACAWRYDGPLVLELPTLPLTGPRELCEDDPSLRPIAGACNASLWFVDDDGVPIPRPLMIMEMRPTEASLAVLQYESSPAGAAEVAFAAGATDGTWRYGSLLVHKPGYRPTLVCAPCDVATTWTLPPMPRLDQSPPPGGW